MWDEPQAVKAPGRRRYVLGTAIALAGVLTAIVLLGQACVAAFSPSDTVIIVPGTHQVHLDQGKHTSFYEYQTIVDGRFFSTGESLGNMYFTLHPAWDAPGVALSPAYANITLRTR